MSHSLLNIPVSTERPGVEIIGLGISQGLAGIAKGMWNEIRKSREPCGNPGQPSHTRSR